jgi:hypothetical protein
VLIALLVPAAPSGAVVTVTSLADSGQGTLRQAIANAPPNEIIDFNVEGTITLASQLVIDKDLRINGPGTRRLAISGNDQVRVMSVSNGAKLVLSGLTLRDGFAGAGDPQGGAVSMFGVAPVVTLTRVAIVDSQAAGHGGGIGINTGALTVIDSTIARNRAQFGGGIGVSGFSITGIVNSTIARNEAASGGGVYHQQNLAIVDSTIARNTATVQGGGVTSFDTQTIQRSLVAGNTAPTAPACSGHSLDSLGENVVDDTSDCSISAELSDRFDVDAPIGALADNGGPTETILLLAGNPAIDLLAAPCAAPAFDQRAIARPQNGRCDVGAVEIRPAGVAVAGSLVLPSVRVGSRSAPATATLRNPGDLPIELVDVRLAGPHASEFDWLGGGCATGVVLDAGESCALTARFAPSTPGAKTAAFTIAPDGQAALGVPVSATALANPPAAPAPVVRSALATLRDSSVRARARGVLRPRVTCAATNLATCEGTLTLRIGSRRLTAPFSVPTGKTAQLRLRVPKAQLRRLTRRGFLIATATTRTTQPTGPAKTAQAPLVLLPRR